MEGRAEGQRDVWGGDTFEQREGRLCKSQEHSSDGKMSSLRNRQEKCDLGLVREVCPGRLYFHQCRSRVLVPLKPSHKHRQLCLIHEPANKDSR